LSPLQSRGGIFSESTRFDFGDEKTPPAEFVLHEKIIEDRGSKYSISLGVVLSREEIKSFLKTLKENKKYAKATHHAWAARINHDEVI